MAASLRGLGRFAGVAPVYAPKGWLPRRHGRGPESAHAAGADKISVLIPSYCHAHYVGAAIRSVAAQTYPNVQLVIVDDGSTDDSPRAIRRALRKSGLTDVIFEQQANAGAPAALNRAMELADGKYVSILNSDDVYHPERLARLHAFAKDHGHRFVFSEVEFGPRALDVEDHATSQAEWLATIDEFPALSFALLRANGCWTSSNFFFAADLVDETGGFRDFRLVHDWDFVLRVIQACEPGRLGEKLVFYRQHRRNTLTSANTLRLTIDEYRAAVIGYFTSILVAAPSNTQAPAPQNQGEDFFRFIARPTALSVGHWAFPSHDVLWRTAELESQADPEVDAVPPQALMTLVGSTTADDFARVGREFRDYLIEYAGLLPSHDVLDIGCGSGRMARQLTAYLDGGGSYTGVDVVPELIGWCEDNIASKHPNFRFHRVDVCNAFYNPGGAVSDSSFEMPFESSSFDLVFLASVFTHMKPSGVEAYLAEIARVLRPGGRLLATFFLNNLQSRSTTARGLSAIDFDVDRGIYRTSSTQPVAEAAVSYAEDHVLALLRANNLRISDEPRYGSWCGRRDYLSFQDIVIAEKPVTATAADRDVRVG